MLFPVCARGDVGEARAPRLGIADGETGAPDVAQRPQYERETKHRRDAGVVSEPESQIVIAAGLEQGERVSVCSRASTYSRGLCCKVIAEDGRTGINWIRSFMRRYRKERL